MKLDISSFQGDRLHETEGGNIIFNAIDKRILEEKSAQFTVMVDIGFDCSELEDCYHQSLH